jgi:hypothetical protein
MCFYAASLFKVDFIESTSTRCYIRAPNDTLTYDGTARVPAKLWS